MAYAEFAIITCCVLCFVMYFYVLRIVIELISKLNILGRTILEFEGQRDGYTRMIEAFMKFKGQEEEEPDKEHEATLPDDGLNPWLTP